MSPVVLIPVELQFAALAVLLDVAEKHPQEFAEAEHSTAFIRRAAKRLRNEVSEAFGLLGKRGTDQISVDALVLRTTQGLRVIDCIGLGPNGKHHTIHWLDVTYEFGPQPRWIAPNLQVQLIALDKDKDCVVKSQDGIDPSKE